MLIASPNMSYHTHTPYVEEKACAEHVRETSSSVGVYLSVFPLFSHARPFFLVCVFALLSWTGLPAMEERISVGFLKLDEHMLDKLPRYAQAYDVVIIGDGDMSYANEILHEIVG